MAKSKKPKQPAAEAVKTSTAAQAKEADQKLATDWLKAIESRRNSEKEWRERRAPKVIERFRDDRGAMDGGSRFNILWANTETLKPAILSKMPIPDIRRRYPTKNTPARTAAMMLERAVSFYMEQGCLDDCMERSLEDYLLPGRAMCVVRYRAVIDKQDVRVGVPRPDPAPADEAGVSEEEDYPEGTQFDEQGNAYRMEQREDVVYHEIYPEYQPWNLVVFAQAKTWKKVPWVALGTLLTKDEIKQQYQHLTDNDLGNIAFSHAMRQTSEKEHESGSFALFWDIWDKTHRKFIVVAEGLERTVVVEADPLKLEDFYPIPEPVYSIRTNQNWEPIPEYLLYQDQALQLDEAMERLDALTKALKVRGVYDKGFDNEEGKSVLGNLLKAPDLTLVPIADFRMLVEKGGLKAIIDTLPLKEIADTIDALRERVLELKQVIYEVTGISDIVRGATKASETLGAQQLKAQYSGLRISKRQDRFQRYGAEIFSIAAEIIAEHVDPQTLAMISGVQVMDDVQYAELKKAKQLETGMVSTSDFMAAIQILKSDKLRGFKIDVEADSTIPADKEGEQKLRVDFLTMVGAYLQNVMPAVQQGLVPPAVAREGLLFGVRAFKVGSEFEEVLEQLGQEQNDDEIRANLQKVQMQAQQMAEENAKLKDDNVKLQSKQQVAIQAERTDAMIREKESQHKMVLEEREQMHKHQLEMQNAQHEAAMLDQKTQFEQNAASQKMGHEQKLKESSAKVEESKAKAKETSSRDSVDTKRTLADVVKRIDAMAQNMEALAKIVADVATTSKAPKRRKGRATLPSGGTMDFEIEDGVGKARMGDGRVIDMSVQ